jgi:2-dehydropantoate 2-reductase
MRIIVYGVGAIGGTVAAALTLSGQPVIGIARGTQLAALQANGLLLRTPDKTERAVFPCVGDPSEIDVRSDDLILLTMKTQDTLPALERLRAAGVVEQPIFCVQNGVANERFALRRFREVHGVTVMMPATLPTPGEVSAFSTPRHGIFDIGRYPRGSNEHDARLAHALETGNIAAFVTPDVMQSKYGKLLLNLGNIVEAALGVDADRKPFVSLLQEKPRLCFKPLASHGTTSGPQIRAVTLSCTTQPSRGFRDLADRRRRAWHAAQDQWRPTTSTARSCSSVGSMACQRRQTPSFWT